MPRPPAWRSRARSWSWAALPPARPRTPSLPFWRSTCTPTRLIVATSVDGVYTADPEKDPAAKKLATMTHHALARLAMETEMKAGSRSPVDPLAAKIIERSSIPTAIVLGSKIENLRKGALGGHTGTEIRPE